MKSQTLKIMFITNFCPHYVTKLFEMLAYRYDINFYFTGGYESYWNKENKSREANIKAKYLKGIFLLPKIKITPALFPLCFKKFDIFIKTIDDRFALPLVFIVAKILKKPFILWTGLWSHPKTFFHRATYAFTRFIYEHSDAIITYGEHVKKYLVELEIPSEKIFCAPHSTDNNIFNKHVSNDEKRQLESKLNLKESKTILYVGRFEECKGLDYLIDAASSLKEVAINMLFIGNGAYRDKIEKKCKEISLQCHFLGHIDNQDLYRYYAIADVFVLPSITTEDFKEPWGIVVNEAMNQGCPVIATNAVGAAQGGLIENGINGFIVPERNVGELKKALENVLKDDKLQERLRKAAREKMKQWNHEEMSYGFDCAIEYVLKQTTLRRV